MLSASSALVSNQLARFLISVSSRKTTPEAAAETPGGPVEASLKDKLANKAGVYSGKLANKADEYLGETPEAAQKRTQLQNKLKKSQQLSEKCAKINQRHCKIS